MIFSNRKCHITVAMSTIGSFQFRISMSTYTLQLEFSIVSLKMPFNCADEFHATELLTNIKSNIPRNPLLYHFLKWFLWVKKHQFSYQNQQDPHITCVSYTPEDFWHVKDTFLLPQCLKVFLLPISGRVDLNKTILLSFYCPNRILLIGL